MLNSNALTTVARLADFMGIDTPASGSADERRLESYINSISNYIARITGVTFKKTTYTNEEYTAEQGQDLNLKHYPIITSEPFIIERRNSGLNEDNWETIDGSYYEVDTDAGIVHAMAGIFFGRGRHAYRVTYTAGYDFNNSTTFLSDTGAGDIELAVWLIGQDFYTNKGQDVNVKSEKIGDYQVTYGSVQGVMFNNPQALEILNVYGDLIGRGPLTPLQ